MLAKTGARAAAPTSRLLPSPRGDHPVQRGPGAGGGRPGNIRRVKIHLEQPVDASQAELWKACATAEGIARWQADVASGDALEDGRLRLEWPALGASLELDVVAAEEGERLVLRSGDSLVEMTFSPGAVEVTHEGISGDEAEGMTASWRAALALLAHHLERQRGRDREVHWFVRTVATSAEAAHAYFTDEAALASWLTTEGGVHTEGARHELGLIGGGTLSGRVLANIEGRDVVLTWKEDGDSALTFRTLPSPLSGSRIVAAVWSRWTDEPATEKRAAQLEAAVGRLARVLESGGKA